MFVRRSIPRVHYRLDGPCSRVVCGPRLRSPEYVWLLLLYAVAILQKPPWMNSHFLAVSWGGGVDFEKVKVRP